MAYAKYNEILIYDFSVIGDALTRVSYISRRSVEAVITIFATIFLTFLLIHLAPGDPIAYMVSGGGGGYGPPVDPEIIEAVRARFGLDRPLHEQLLRYIINIFKGDFGFSITYMRPVSEVITSRIGNTLLLFVASITFSTFIGIILGMYASRKPGSLTDTAFTIGSTIGFSVPTFWLGQMLIMILTLRLGLFPSSGVTSAVGGGDLLDILWHLFLPAITLGIVHLALIARLTRVSTLETSKEDYIITARAKGLSERAVMFRHILRNSLLPVVTVVGLRTGYMFAGSVLVETVFAWPGLGLLMYRAVLDLDYPILLGLLFMIAVLVTLMTLITDILYSFFDPRIVHK